MQPGAIDGITIRIRGGHANSRKPMLFTNSYSSMRSRMVGSWPVWRATDASFAARAAPESCLEGSSLSSGEERVALVPTVERKD